MSDDKDQTNPKSPEFDFSAHPPDALFHERRYGRDRRNKPAPPAEPRDTSAEPPRGERRERKERRRRIDPTTFDKQYSEDEIEFMNAMQRFKERSGKTFPTYGEVLRVAASLGYRRLITDTDTSWTVTSQDEPTLVQPFTIDA
jgi:hypothetical protein